VPIDEPATRHATLSTDTARRRGRTHPGHRGVRQPVWTLRLPPDHGAAEAGWLAGWQGPGGAHLASRRAEGSTEAVCSTISTSLHACGNVLPFATATSTCRSRFTICSAVCFFPFAIIRPFCTVPLTRTGTKKAGHSTSTGALRSG